MTGRRGEVIAHALHVPEGPVVLGDGRIAFVEQVLGRVSMFDGRRVSVLAAVGGAANSVVLGDDDALYATQNGGVVGAWRSSDPRPPGIQRVHLDGRVETVATVVAGVRAMAPNDLVFGPDGRLYFTDPAHAYDPVARGAGGRVFALGRDGGDVVAEVGAVYCNGIAFRTDGRLTWVESYDRHVCALGDDGRREVVMQLPEGHVPDGLAVAADGRVFIATVTSHGVTVVDPDGDLVDFIKLDDDALPTNCCFDGSSLVVTDFGVDHEAQPGVGRLWRLETDAVGAPLHAASVSPVDSSRPNL